MLFVLGEVLNEGLCQLKPRKFLFVLLFVNKHVLHMWKQAVFHGKTCQTFSTPPDLVYLEPLAKLGKLDKLTKESCQFYQKLIINRNNQVLTAKGYQLNVKMCAVNVKYQTTAS